MPHSIWNQFGALAREGFLLRNPRQPYHLIGGIQLKRTRTARAMASATAYVSSEMRREERVSLFGIWFDLWEKLERRTGVEPVNAGFADLCVSHFATGAFETHCWAIHIGAPVLDRKK